MSGSKFSTSRGTVIYVSDFLREFGPDALRYFISVAGPENQDTDFTWDEFVRRTNFELANEWGNLVNRSISMAHKNVGAVPKPTAAGRRRRRAAGDVAGGVRHRRRPAGAQQVQAGGRPRRCGWSTAANKYLSDQEPWKRKDDPDRRDTILHTALQVVAGREHAAHAVPAALRAAGARGAGRRGRVGGAAGGPGGRRPRGTGRTYPVLTGDYARRAGALGVDADRGRAAAGQADAAVRQAGPGAGGDGPGLGPDRPVSPGPGRPGCARRHGANAALGPSERTQRRVRSIGGVTGAYGRRERPAAARAARRADGRRAHPPRRLRLCRRRGRGRGAGPGGGGRRDPGRHRRRRPGERPLGGRGRALGRPGVRRRRPAPDAHRGRDRRRLRGDRAAGRGPAGGRRRRDRARPLLGPLAAAPRRSARSAGTSTSPSGSASR